ncbi:ATPase [Aestuariibacter halophilus]|uniref:ATPase n=1 Tax=Fluctibacter halophilus TaxID=226011 RepID=A0ABS8G9Q6_9ALTE|nr:BadF/BadG/BcrA/BcrD ATPase family protein [Aestuariibacter halophilus]MCC2617309.1 ATPase [Aestuariibacter halophilus]
MSRHDKLFLGIDGGGSKCRALLCDAQGNALGTGQSGPANPNQGLQQTIESVIDATHQALQAAHLPKGAIAQLHVGLGLAGLNLPKYRTMVQQWAHPFASMQIASDLWIACLGAHGESDGAVIITGTGSTGMVSVDGEVHEFGGHGFSVGDQGSGAWLGLFAIRQALQALDGLLPSAPMVDKILDTVGCSDAQSLAEKMAGQSPARFARLAPLVIDCAKQQDPMATALVQQGADYINRLAHRLLAFNPPRLSMIGGLAPILFDWLDEDIQARLEPARFSPEYGAVLFARQHACEDTL